MPAKSQSDNNFTQHPRLNNLLTALKRCQGFGLYFARSNTVALRQSLVNSLKTVLPHPIVEITIEPNQDRYIDTQLKDLVTTAPKEAVVFVYGIETLFYLQEQHLLKQLNLRRESYGRIPHPLVFWLPEFVLREIFQHAPDFADWHSGVYEFNLSATEQEQMTTQTWAQVNNKRIDSLSLAEKQRWIVNLKSLLAELDSTETTTQGELENRLGELYASLGNYESALDYYQQALALFQRLQDKKKEGMLLNNIGYIYQQQGDYEQALVWLQNSRTIRKEAGDKGGKAATLDNIAQIYHAKGDEEQALKLYQESLKIREDLGDQAGKAVTLNNIALIYQARGDEEQALKLYQEALTIRQDLGDQASKATTLANIALIYQARGDYQQALTLLQEALTIGQAIGHQAGECSTLFKIGKNYQGSGYLQKAYPYWRQSYQIAKKIGLAAILNALEQLAKQQGGQDLSYWEKS
jgi:tetratricopeptide (TPR) repeat protein